jgi:hypothetical protein
MGGINSFSQASSGFFSNEIELQTSRTANGFGELLTLLFALSVSSVKSVVKKFFRVMERVPFNVAMSVLRHES